MQQVVFKDANCVANAKIKYSYLAVMESQDLVSVTMIVSGPFLRVAARRLQVSKATDLGYKTIVLRLWILQGYGLAKL